MIKYDIYIDNEIAVPVIIKTMDMSEDYIQSWNRFLNLLPFAPQVIEYTSLGHTPELGDSWNGSNFVSQNGSAFADISNNTASMRYFALIVDGIVEWIYQIQDSAENQAFIAAILSGPEFKPAL
jgi:hypothetical protein